MLGCQYKLMDRFYVMVGETFRGIVHEPVFIETTADGTPVCGRPDRLDGWYLGVPTGRRWTVPPPRPKPSLALALAAGVLAALLTWNSKASLP
jgi:hypothetical protein